MEVPGLRQARLAVPLTQRELAAKADVTQATVVRGEQGLPVRISTVRKLAEALGVTAATLLNTDDDRTDTGRRTR